MSERSWLRLPVVSAGAEHMVMGYLMRRNILTYKTPPGHEGYDLICIHPDPRYTPRRREKAQVRIQVKSRYATDSDKGFPVKEKTLNAFDFLILALLNIGKFYRGHDGLSGMAAPEFFTLPVRFVRKHHEVYPSWQRVRLRGLENKIEPFRNEQGFEQIAKVLGIKRPQRELPSKGVEKREGGV